METALSVALVQHASGLDPAANRDDLDRLVPAGHDLVVLPEAFARDFGQPGSALGEYAERQDGAFGSRLAEVAGERDTTVVAGMWEAGEDRDRPYNTLLVRGAAQAAYRKIHLYDSFGFAESDTVLPGPVEGAPLVDLAGWQLGLMTCYDLRFPELARRLPADGADVLVLPAAWVAGERKLEHWRTLLRARAIENTVFVLAAAQPGPRYTGHSMVVAPTGDVLAEAGDGEETLTAELDPGVLAEVRRTNPSLVNRRL